MREEVPPTHGTAQTGKCDPHDTYSHDAYGLIHLMAPEGGDRTMFGSDIGHSRRLSISVSRAKLERNLSNDWIHTVGRPIIEIELSHAQFAQFITSPGNGSGTPCTIRYAPPVGTPTVEMPAIKNLETKAQTIRREIRESSNKQVAELKRHVSAFGEMLEAGKVGIKDAREIHKHLTWALQNLPANMEFVVAQGEEALEKAQSAAMIELEAYATSVAHRLGLQSIAQLGRIANGEINEKQPKEIQCK